MTELQNVKMSHIHCNLSVNNFRKRSGKAITVALAATSIITVAEKKYD